MDTSQLAHPKGRPVALERQDRRKALTARDDKWSKAVRARSGGRCEVVELIRVGLSTGLFRCERRACEVNHLLGGRGVRGRGESALSIRKIHMCKSCHNDYHAHTLRRAGGVVPHYQDIYERVR